jgi:pimeloyl-ACP methyl ester carboxylesterase
VRTWIAAASIVLFVLAWVAASRLEPQQQTGILRVTPRTPYIHYSPDTVSRVVLVVHGLDSSKQTMRIISSALADSGYEVYNIDLPGHGDSLVGFDAAAAREAIRNVLSELGPDTVVLGHSLGAGLLLDLAQDQHFQTMVLLSPPPVPVSEIQADRVLLITGAYDVGRVRAFAPLVKDMGSPRIEWWSLPWAAHSSAIFNPAHIRRIVDWLGNDGTKTRTTARLISIAGMLLSGLALGLTLMPGSRIEPASIPIPSTVVRYVLASGIAVLISTVVVPLAWLRLFATDYVISFLFVTGLVLSVQEFHWPRVKLRGILKGVAAASFVIVVLGLIAGSHVLHMTLSDGRWWRFLAITAAGFPFFLADELTIRKIHPRWKSIAVALITRALFWAFIVTAVLLFNRGDAFIVLIAHLIVFFWIGLWFAADIVHRHTHDAFATALFAAIVQGWMFAAWFVVR